MKPYRTILLAAALLPLSSCVEWRIGKNIRESGERITALQLATPVDGRLYASRQEPPVAAEKEWEYYPDWQDRDTTYYAHVPVVEYGRSSSTLFWHLPHAIGGTGETADKPTGQSRIVAIRGSKVYLMPGNFEMPQGLRRVDADRLGQGGRHVDLSTSGSTLAAIAAAPFDYLIDPALSAISTAAVATIGGIGVGLWRLGDTLVSPFTQNGSDSPSSTPGATAPINR